MANFIPSRDLPQLNTMACHKEAKEVRDKYFQKDGDTVELTAFLEQESRFAVEEIDRDLRRLISSAEWALERLHDGKLTRSDVRDLPRVGFYAGRLFGLADSTIHAVYVAEKGEENDG